MCRDWSLSNILKPNILRTFSPGSDALQHTTAPRFLDPQQALHLSCTTVPRLSRTRLRTRPEKHHALTRLQPTCGLESREEEKREKKK